jgi:hypothetical protein
MKNERKQIASRIVPPRMNDASYSLTMVRLKQAPRQSGKIRMNVSGKT